MKIETEIRNPAEEQIARRDLLRGYLELAQKVDGGLALTVLKDLASLDQQTARNIVNGLVKLKTQAAPEIRPPIFHYSTPCGELIFDPMKKRAISPFKPEEQISLTRREATILELLMQNPQTVVTYEDIIRSFWPNANCQLLDQKLNLILIRQIVHLLRRKLNDPYKPKLIHTVKRIGYILNPDIPKI